MPTCRLEERVSNWRDDSQVDSSSRLVKRIVLSGADSRNGYRYSEAALRRAASLYENKPVFLDHADRVRDGQARSTRDLVGSIVNVEYADGRIRGDVRVLDTESGRTFLALADGNAPGVGMSHVVLAERSADGTVVERIQDVLSVDVVVRPATTRTFRESIGGAIVETEGVHSPDGRRPFPGSVLATGPSSSALTPTLSHSDIRSEQETPSWEREKSGQNRTPMNECTWTEEAGVDLPASQIQDAIEARFASLMERWDRMLTRLEAAESQGCEAGGGDDRP